MNATTSSSTGASQRSGAKATIRSLRSTADEAGKFRGLVPGGVQPAGVEGQHGGVVGSGAVAHHEHPLRVAAQGCSLLQAISQRFGAVFQKVGVTHHRVQAVVGHQRQHTARGQCCGDELVLAPLAAVPRAAVEKHHDRIAASRCGHGRAVDI